MLRTLDQFIGSEWRHARKGFVFRIVGTVSRQGGVKFVAELADKSTFEPTLSWIEVNCVRQSEVAA